MIAGLEIGYINVIKKCLDVGILLSPIA